MLLTKEDYENKGTTKDFELLLSQRYISNEAGRIEDSNAKLFRIGYTVKELTDKGVIDVDPLRFEKDASGNLVEYELQPDGTRYSHYLDAVNSVCEPDLSKINEVLVQTNETQAKITRQEAIDSDIEYKGVMWQVSEKSLKDIDVAIDTARILEEVGKPVPETISWTLSDNTERPTTNAELKELKLAYASRVEDVFTQFKTWRAGDKLTAFEYSPQGD